MPSPTSLTGTHLRTYNAIFHHPAAHNLAWHDVHALFRHLGTVEEQPNGNLKVTRHGQTLVLHPPRTKEVADTDELIALRHFLEKSAASPSAPALAPGAWLLVIDHHRARIFRTVMAGAVPQQILPHEPDDFFRHAPHSKQFTRGQEKPDPNSYFAPVASALQAGGEILIFGTGTGTGSEMDQFTAWANHHHPALAARIVGTLVVDENHRTDAQLLAKAREFYAGQTAATT
jgi:hypothetical protein